MQLMQLLRLGLIASILIMVSACGGELNSNLTGENTEQVHENPGGGNGNEQTNTDLLFNGDGTASLSWIAPSVDSEGYPLDNLAGYNVYISDGYGFVKIATIDSPTVTEYVVNNLSSGSFEFVVTSYTSEGVESVHSNPAYITII